MTTAPSTAVSRREPELLGQAVVIIGGSAGIGLETARLATAEGAAVILAARRPDRLRQAAAEVGAADTVAFDATDPAALERFFAGLPTPVARASFWALVAPIVFGIVLIFVQIPGADLAYSVLGLVIFAGFTLFDFQRARANTDVASAPLLAASIFLDILNVFLFFLQIFTQDDR